MSGGRALVGLGVGAHLTRLVACGTIVYAQRCPISYLAFTLFSFVSSFKPSAYQLFLLLLGPRDWTRTLRYVDSTQNPMCPTMHFNYRYFETDGGVWWFGGGTDITPAYLDEVTD